MEVILDANCCADALRLSDDSDFKTFMLCLMKGKATLSFGGTKILKEYSRISDMEYFLRELDRSGKTSRIDTALVDERAAVLSSQGALQSDDPHVVAIGQLGKARLLCTKDQALICDFTDKNMIANPRGKIYSGERNKHLLRQALPKSTRKPRA